MDPIEQPLPPEIWAATPAFAGPPWISLETPANPYNETTRGAFALVRVYHHGDAAYFPVSGTAEGLINGVRQSVDLQLASTSIPGVYALRYEPKKEGAWLLVIRTGQKNSGEMGQATMVVSVRNGELSSAQVPTKQSTWFLMQSPPPRLMRCCGSSWPWKIRSTVHRLHRLPSPDLRCFLSGCW